MRAKGKLAVAISILAFTVVALYTTAKASSTIGDAWTAFYPTSRSLDNVKAGTGSSCQFCHLFVSGVGYNGYGWAVRGKVRSGMTNQQAFSIITSYNSDMDLKYSTNQKEIYSNSQPGWTSGGNTVYINYSTFRNWPAPSNIVGNLDPTTCTDNDHDGYAIEGGSCGAVDCNDADSSIHPGAAEICNDGKDNDCNGLTDTNDPVCASGCGKDAAWTSYYSNSNSLSNIASGTGKSCQFCHNSFNGGDGWNGYGWGVRQKLLSGMTNEAAFAAVESYNSDNDPALFANIAEVNSNSQPGWTPGSGNRIYFKSYTTIGYQYPPSGILGELDPAPTCTDADHDGYFSEGGNCGVVDCNDNDSTIHPGATEVLYNGIDENCNGMADDDDLDHDGYGIATDCNDNDASINTSAAEIPYNGIDENCNGLADDDDLDQDGYGIASDCNDNNASIHPGAIEILYNGIDENCNGMADDDDLDHDGYDIATDCNDNNASTHPGAAEILYNGIDENCNGMSDDDDLDKDGYAKATDCNDGNPSIHPNATEIKSDGIDQDCNGYDLTINITTATYDAKRKILTVEATSSLKAGANLQVAGFGPMIWKKNISKWTISVSGIANPGTVTVSGIEGSTSLPVTVK